MASIFTYDPHPPRVSSPWSTPGTSTPQETSRTSQQSSRQINRLSSSPILLAEAGVSRLEPEPQEGPTEYKLHLLLRPRRKFMSSSTGSHISGSQHSKAYLAASGSRVGGNIGSGRPALAPSSQSRQARLQHLTTQLLWRLQQSSPFHSSSAANLVLPVLPEATPRLNVPVVAAKLLPGLEESQGALYEIGVSDDGTFVGLIEEELEESLTNLQAMAASLGCVVEVLRKVIVGDCQWAEVPVETEGAEQETHRDKLWVAEALVRPNLDSSAEVLRDASSWRSDEQAASTVDVTTMTELPPSKTEQLRVSLIGSSGSGKSSLLGTLSTSTLDNGRGKSRLSLLRHRHEISSGITSSVAQELIGYRSYEVDELSDQQPESEDVINYAMGNVSSWNDIHGYADRLVFLSDSPGLAKFSKSTIRTLISWQPHWTVICVAANEDEESTATSVSDGIAAGGLPALTPEPSPDLTLSHLDLCMGLGLPFIIAITKMDLATRSGLRQTLAKVLSALKAKGKKPVVLSSATGPVSSAADVQGRLQNPEIECSVDLQHISAIDDQDVQRVICMGKQDSDCVPIVLTSAVSGIGIGKVHGLLRSLPLPDVPESANSPSLPGEGRLGEISHTLKSFHIDEVFTMPPSKVYSPSSTEHADKGIVLCGRMASGAVSVGEHLALGPFDALGDDRLVQEASTGGPASSRPQQLAVSAPTARTSSSEVFSRSTTREAARVCSDPGGIFISVRVVSIRNLRLPVRSLLSDQVGTIGVELVSPASRFGSFRAVRRGMVLLSPTSRARACRSVTGRFRSSDFAFATSPPLILGGHAMVYVNSVRAAVKVTAVALAESEASESSSPTEMFSFDSEINERGNQNGLGGVGNDGIQDLEITITFRFVSSVEWIQAGDKILVVPNLSAAGPITGPSGATSGLTGFVGRVIESNG